MIKKAAWTSATESKFNWNNCYLIKNCKSLHFRSITVRLSPISYAINSFSSFPALFQLFLSLWLAWIPWKILNQAILPNFRSMTVFLENLFIKNVWLTYPVFKKIGYEPDCITRKLIRSSILEFGRSLENPSKIKHLVKNTISWIPGHDTEKEFG